ncbi:hypothetical protein M0805_008829 [Coniferiporia weirii]|nr:hypothetical protein M0805_008829 [Coniferiporia weirii]
METPPRDARKEARRRFTTEEKKQLLANLDIEVAHRTRQFEESLAQILESFKNHHEGQVLRVPKLVRNITMGEFADKYNGDINECLRGLQRERQGGEPTLDPSLKKRKWKDSEDAPGPEDAESSRASKTARMASPVKMDAAKILKARLNKTPGKLRAVHHPHPQFGPTSPTKLKPVGRSTSPFKASSSRLPSSKEFNPLLPKTPAYPRAPRKNESLMSINGSPLLLPSSHRFAPDVFDDEGDGVGGPQQTIRRTKSIVLRRDPSYSSQASQPRDGSHSRAPSQASQPSVQSRSRSPSRAAHSSSGSSSSIPSSSDTVAVSQPSALMRVPTKDGLILEFDPLLTTPDELDTLEGITDSAKKQAREDMTKLVQAALARWKI